MPHAFTHPEIQSLIRAFAGGGAMSCPRCQGPLDRREVAPRPDVSYVRHRVWISCPRCGAAKVLDRREDVP